MTPKEREKRIRAQMEAMRPMTKEEIEAKNLREAPLLRNAAWDARSPEQIGAAMQDPLLVERSKQDMHDLMAPVSCHGEWTNVATTNPPSLWERIKICLRWLRSAP